MGVDTTPPTGWEIEWIAAEPLLERGRPHRRRREHIGARLEVPAVRDRTRQIVSTMRMPSRAMPSASGWKRRRAEASKQWDESVHSGRHREERRQSDGQFRILDGDLGIIMGWKMIFFSWVASRVITPARPTSEPVPAVVGTAMIGAMPSVLARVHQSPTSSKSHTGRVCATMKATHLPTSSADPPPTATTPSCPPAR